MNPVATEVRRVEVASGIDLTAFASRIGPVDPANPTEADRAGYLAGYAGMESPDPRDPTIPGTTFRARCVGWARGSNDRADGKPPQFANFAPREVEQEPRTTHQDTVTISAVAEAEWSGFTLGCNGLAVVGPAHYSAEERAAFVRGHAAGFAEYEEAEFEAWVSEQGSEWAHAEMVEANGVTSAREGSAR